MGGRGSGRRNKSIPQDPESIRFREAADRITKLALDPVKGAAVEEFCRILWPLHEDQASWEVLIFATSRGWFRPGLQKRKEAA